jgi:pimeloyl-ACP methyl ester carboxylesterase
MLVDLVHTVTADDVALDGVLRTPARARSDLGLDLVIMHHGVGGNFYRQSFFDDLGTALLEAGCAALRVNNRGHAQVVAGPHGNLGARYEVVDDARQDWRAWLDFAERAGYRRIALWGHSLGGVKTIYYQAVEVDPRVVCAIASSPPRFEFDAFLNSEDGPRFKTDMEQAQALVAAGQAEATVAAVVPVVQTFTARTYVDKYGPSSRYDILRHVASTRVPLLVTLGELEIDGLAFRDLAKEGPALHDRAALVQYALIAGADHSYATREAELWRTARSWLGAVGVAPAVATR